MEQSARGYIGANGRGRQSSNGQYIAVASFDHNCCLLLFEGAHNCLGVPVNDGQQDAGGTIRDSPALFPILYGTGIQSKPVREFLATELHALAERQYVLCRRIVDNPAGQRRFAPDMGKHLAQGSFQFMSYLGSLSRHRMLPSFLIVVTSRDSAFLSAELRSS